MGWRSSLEAFAEEKTSFPCRDSNAEPSRPVASRYADFAVSASD